MTISKYEVTHFTNATNEELLVRNTIRDLAKKNLQFNDEFFRDLFLYTHSGVLARSLAIRDLYIAVHGTPGLFLDFGTWKGANIVLLENFRAIYDPFDVQRKMIGFDTFTGYEGFAKGESKNSSIQNSSYSLSEGYAFDLQTLIRSHERANGKKQPIHEIIVGNAVEKLRQVLKNEDLPVALAIFDMNAFKPTFETLQQILPKLNKGSFISFWQFTRPEINGERKAFQKVRNLLPEFILHKSDTYPSLIHCEIL